MKYIIGIDIGTTNTKALAYNSSGDVLAQQNKSYRPISPAEGYHELDPLVLLEAVTSVIRNVVDECAGNELSGICFSAAMHGLMAVEEDGSPFTNMITWADLRSSAYARQLKVTETGDAIYRATGVPIHAMSPLCKLMWMKDHLPEIFRTAHKFISIKEFIFHKLFGKFVIDNSVASSTGLFDIHTRSWNKLALETAGITTERLSHNVPSTSVISGLKSEYASLLNINAGIPFVIGGSDGCMAHIGSNAMQERDVSLTIGTSGALRIMTDEPVYDARQRIFTYLITDNLYLSGGPINNGGNVLQWFGKAFLKKDFISPADFDTYISEALMMPPGADELVFLPYIYGERAPVWDAEARGIFYGVSANHTSRHFMRAVIEGISFALLSILQSLEEVMGPVNNIYVSGGFIRSRDWVKLLADVLGKKLYVTHAEDASAAGAVILGMKALGIVTDWKEASGFFTAKEEYLPDPAYREVYRRNFAVYSNLYEKFKEIKK